MKSCSILISNYNSFEAIQLCIESIKKRTDYPDYQIVVYDDESSNGVDLPYLEKAESKGWIRFIHGNRQRWANEIDALYAPHKIISPSPYWHGCALNVLVNEICDTELAMIMDADVYIKEADWLSKIVEKMDEKTLLICDERPPCLQNYGYDVGNYNLWFGLLNMKTYNDGMKIDWRGKMVDRREEPYLSLINNLYPPQEKCKEEYEKASKIEFFDENRVCLDPGSELWIAMKMNNPKGYKVKTLPHLICQKFRHFGHISVVSENIIDLNIHQKEIWQLGLIPVKKVLEELRTI